MTGTTATISSAARRGLSVDAGQAGGVKQLAADENEAERGKRDCREIGDVREPALVFPDRQNAGAQQRERECRLRRRASRIVRTRGRGEPGVDPKGSIRRIFGQGHDSKDKQRQAGCPAQPQQSR